MNDIVNELFDQIVAESTKELQEELKTTQILLDQYVDKCTELYKENAKLQKMVTGFNLIVEVNQLIKEENFDYMLPLFKLKSNNLHTSGMHIEDVPKWFIYLSQYYEDRDKLFNLMDIFGVKYPAWAKKYTAPQDYSEHELEIFIDNILKHYVCNSCIFESNLGFFWEKVREHSGDTSRILTKSTYSEIPWQMILSNPLWINDKLFDKMLAAIKSKKSNSDYFFRIQEFLDISDEHVNDLINLIPTDHIYDIHKQFIKKNINLVKLNKAWAERFKDKMSDESYSIFYYLNYHIDYQKAFIKKYDDFVKQASLIKKMSISEKEKIEFVKECLSEKI